MCVRKTYVDVEKWKKAQLRVGIVIQELFLAAHLHGLSNYVVVREHHALGQSSGSLTNMNDFVSPSPFPAASVW